MHEKKIEFIIDVDAILTGVDTYQNDFQIIQTFDKTTRIKLFVYDIETWNEDERENKSFFTIVPFQIAYAVSIHKSQGLEFKSVKVIIPNSNSEKITHGIFYTAITRAKNKLKIYWSPETMLKVLNGFNEDKDHQLSLDIIKHKLIKLKWL